MSECNRCERCGRRTGLENLCIVCVLTDRIFEIEAKLQKAEAKLQQAEAQCIMKLAEIVEKEEESNVIDANA